MPKTMALKTTLPLLVLVTLNVFIISPHVAGQLVNNCQGTECEEEELDISARYLEVVANATVRIATVLPRIADLLEDYVAGQMTADNITSTAVEENEGLNQENLPRDCMEVAAWGNDTSGYYTIRPILPNHLYPNGEITDKSVTVYCDMDTDGGGWTVFQRRQNGGVGFHRDWEDYKQGFGYLQEDYWLGLDMLHKLTASGNHKLRIDLQDFYGNSAYAQYDEFVIGDESSFYMLVVGYYEGTAGDSLRYHNGKGFSTKDQDHDNYSGNCAQVHKGAWWYDSCVHSNLNGLYLGRSQTSSTGMTWKNWKNNWEVLRTSEMKVRRIN